MCENQRCPLNNVEPIPYKIGKIRIDKKILKQMFLRTKAARRKSCRIVKK
jgi:hypothetical protein